MLCHAIFSLVGFQALPAVGGTDLPDQPLVNLTEHATTVKDGMLSSQAIA
jgi:hypothetical protein